MGRIKICVLLLSAAVVFVISCCYWLGSSRAAVEDSISASANKNPYSIFVDVETSVLTVFKDGEIYKEYDCAGGKLSTPSPVGTWTIISKDVWGEGFGGRWMGFNVPWGKFGIHGTIYKGVIGWNSSHGCIRMNNWDVAELYKYIPHGTKVTIVDGVYGVFGRGFRNIKPGMYGADVMEIQKRLRELGYFSGYANGLYEDTLKTAVHKYQKDKKMQVTNTITPHLIESLGFIQAD